jgi:cell division protein FtsB
MQPSSVDDTEYRAPRRNRSINGTQLMFAVIIAIALMLAINFSSRVSADRDLRQVRDRVDAEIEALRREQGELIQRLAYVQSDAFIEAWAHSEGRMVREGEVLWVLFPSANTTDAQAVATPQVVVEVPITKPTEPWHLWWALFFDNPPPGT